MSIDDETLDDMAACLVPILDDLAARGFTPPKRGNLHAKIRAEYRKRKIEEDPGFWKAVATSTGVRIMKLDDT